MIRLTVKTMAARRSRVVLTAAAVVLGVTFVTGTLVLTDSATAAVDRQFAEALSGVDVVVRDASAADPGMGLGVERRPVPGDVVERIRRVDGVRGAEGLALGSAPLEIRGREVTAGTSVGSSWAEEPYSSFRLRSGRSPLEKDEVVVDAATAARWGVEHGEALGVAGQDGARAFTVVGTAGHGNGTGVPGATVALFTPAVAQQLFGLGDGWSEVHVVAEDVPAATLARRLAGELGEQYAVATSHDVATASAEAARERANVLSVLLAALAGTALVVGAFLIANTFSIAVAQRTREYAVLRALGATAGQVKRSVLTEAVAVGGVSSVVGLALGCVTAAGLRLLTADPAAESGATLSVLPRTVAVALLIGVGVTVLAALLPAHRAARVSPVAALRDGSAGCHTPSRRRVLGGLGLAVVAAVVLGAAGRTTSPLLVALGAVAALAGTVLLGPVFASRLAAGAGHLRRGGVSARLARLNVHRAASRSAAAASALAVGLAVITVVTVVAASAKQAVSAALDEVVRAELVVEDPQAAHGALPPEAYRAARSVPGVAAASRTRIGHWQTAAGRGRAVTGVDPATLPLVADLRMVAGQLSGLSSGGVVVTDAVAEASGLDVGEPVEMTFAKTGVQLLPVVGILDRRDAWVVGGDHLLSLETLDRHVDTDVDAKIFLELTDDADVATLRAAVAEAVSPFTTATVYDQAAAKAASTKSFDSVLAVVSALLVFAVVVALFAITNSLALAVVERTREIGMLRAVGMTRRQVAAMMRAEAVLISVVGGLSGIVLGLGIAAATVHALSDRVVIGLSVPVPRLVAYLLLAGVGGVLAGLVPGRRAARVDVLSAVATG